MTKVLPWLQLVDLQDLLIRPAWLDCAAVSPTVERMLRLLEVNARRDPAAMIEQGKAWLNDDTLRPVTLKALDPLALSSIQFGLLGLQRYSEIAQTEEQYGDDVPGIGDYGISRVLLMNWLPDDP